MGRSRDGKRNILWEWPKEYAVRRADCLPRQWKVSRLFQNFQRLSIVRYRAVISTIAQDISVALMEPQLLHFESGTFFMHAGDWDKTRVISRKPRKLFAPVKPLAKSGTLQLQSCFIHIFLIWTEVPFLQEVSGAYTSPFLDTDEVGKNDFPGLSRNGPQICRVTRQCNRKSDLSCVHVPVHVVTVGDARCDWFKSNPIKLIKVQRQRMKPLYTRAFSRGFAVCAIEAKPSIFVCRSLKKDSGTQGKTPQIL